MHKGLDYPYLNEYWQCELSFWPGFVPRKLYVWCPLGYGTSWDRLNAGIITGVGVPDAFDVGDPGWDFIDPTETWELQVLIHKTGLSPKQYTWAVRVKEDGVIVSSVTFGEMVGPNYIFTAPAWVATSHFPPWSLGVTVPIVVRPATWAEA